MATIPSGADLEAAVEELAIKEEDEDEDKGLCVF